MLPFALPRQELDNAEAQVAAARSDVAALGAEITSSAVQLRYYRITAPSAGVVGDIPVRVGDLVTPQTSLTSVTDNHVLEANLAVPVERAAAVKLGTRVQLVDDDGHVVAEGDVSFSSPSRSNATARTCRAVAGPGSRPSACCARSW